MILERLCRVIYEFDNVELFNLAGKAFDDIFEAYKMANEADREKILGLVEPTIKDKITAMVDGGLI